MKTLLIITLALLILLLACVLAVNYIVNSARDIITRLDGLDEAVEAERWQEARSIYHEAEQEWQRVAARWKIIINHDDMRDIELGFVDLEIVLRQADSEEALRELSTLRYYLLHVPDNERVEWGNVL